MFSESVIYLFFFCVPLLSFDFSPQYDHSHHNVVYLTVVFPAQQPAVTNSSSSEDETGRSGGTVVRRRRLRKNTTSVVTEPEDVEVAESGHSEEEKEEEDEGQQEEQAEVRPAAALDARVQGRSSSILNKCILIALVIAISMGFGHFYGEILLTLL